MSTFVVSQMSKGNWQVVDSDGVTVDGFRNWAVAESHARSQALATNGEVIRLSARTGKVVSHLRPRQAIPVCLRSRSNQPAAYVDLARVLADEMGVTLEETVVTDVADANSTHNNEALVATLRTLSTPELVARYNAVGGRIRGKYKGSRQKLIDAIVAR